MRTGPAVVTVVLALLVGALPARGENACQVEKHAYPAQHGGLRPPLVVGDSGLIYAAPVLARLGLEADAHGCRQIGQGIDLLAARRHAGTLPGLVVLALGANGVVTDADISRALAVIGPDRALGLVTPPTSAASVAAMRRAAARLPRRVVLVDWAGSGLVDRYGGDRIHIGPAGEAVLARFIRRRVASYVPPASLVVPRHRRDAAKPCGTVRQAGRELEVYVLVGRHKVMCERARAIVRASRPRAVAGWRWFDWTLAGRGPWRDVYVRPSGQVVVASAPPVQPA